MAVSSRVRVVSERGAGVPPNRRSLARRRRSARASSPRHLAEFTCTTADEIRLYGISVPPPDSGDGSKRVFVLAHGFTHGIGKPATSAAIAAFAAHGAVVTVDFRGHGRSAGRSSVGRDETLDLDAAVAWARARGYGPVAVVGFSMGGAVSLRHAALGASRPDAVVSVSAPARWYVRESSAMRRVHWLLESPLGPPVGRLFGIRLGEPWDELPTSPIETIGQVAVPILLVHGTADRYFGPAHAIALGRAARTAAEVWVVPGMGHGETGTTAETTHRIARWAEAATAAEGSGTPRGDAGDRHAG